MFVTKRGVVFELVLNGQPSQTVTELDRETWHDLGYGWASDATQVVYLGEPFEDADPGSFHVLGSKWACDAARIFYDGDEPPERDGEPWDVASFVRQSGRAEEANPMYPCVRRTAHVQEPRRLT
jgi:hypothetical protein